MAEFSKKQMALIDANRDYNTAHDWWEDTYDFFIEAASEFGLCVTRDDIEFSGFWSQGDGANFNFEPLSLAALLRGVVDGADKCELPSPSPLTYALLELYNSVVTAVGEALAHLQPSDMIEVLDEITVSTVKINHHYCHARTRRVEMEEPDYLTSDEEAAKEWLPQAAYEALLSNLDGDMERIANCLYRMLEEEYEYLTSDEAVWESMVANNFAGVDRVAA